MNTHQNRPIAERGWIGIDLDGTLAEYHGWPKDGGVGRPIPAMLKLVKQMVDAMLYRDDIAVRIFTARVSPIGRVNVEECAEQERIIKAWCLEHIGVELPVTYAKDFQMVTLYDDRCETVEANTGVLLRDRLREAQNELARYTNQTRSA